MYHPVFEYASVSSTNYKARRLIENGERGPVWLRADEQKAGYGRSGKPWYSPVGNLYATFLFAPLCPLVCLPQLAFVAGLAACDTVSSLVGSAHSVEKFCRLKWPNDILCGVAKIGGVLVETISHNNKRFAIIGYGVNITSKPTIKGREFTAMQELGASPQPDELLGELDYKLYDYLKVCNNGINFDTIRTRWLRRSFPLGAPISVNISSSLVRGTFAGLTEAGALMLRLATGEVIFVNVGEVKVDW